MTQEASSEPFSLVDEFSRFWLWLGKRAVPIGASLIAITVWLCIDFSIVFEVPASPFSSAMLSVLPGLLAAVTITGAAILAIVVMPAVALRIPLNKGEPALIDIEHLNRSLGDRPGMVTTLERRWIGIILLQFAGMPLLDLALGLLPHVSDLIQVPAGAALLAADLYLSYRILIRGIETGRSYDFTLFAVAAIFVQFTIGFSSGHAVVARWFTSNTRMAMDATMLFAIAIPALFFMQAVAARKLRRKVIRAGMLKTAFVYTHIALLAVAILVPLGGEVVAIPLRLAGLHGYRCVVYTVDDASSKSVEPGLLVEGGHTTAHIDFATPPLDGVRYVKVQGDPERHTYRIKDTAIVGTHGCPKTETL